MKKILSVITITKVLFIVFVLGLVFVPALRVFILNNPIIYLIIGLIILGAGAQIVFAQKLRWLALGQVLAVITLLLSWNIPLLEKIIERNKGFEGMRTPSLWEDALGREYLFSLVALAGVMIVFDISYLILVRRMKDKK